MNPFKDFFILPVVILLWLGTGLTQMPESDSSEAVPTQIELTKSAVPMLPDTGYISLADAVSEALANNELLKKTSLKLKPARQD
ncbi:MAG: hypothetical protein COT43_06545 [Candidatus Marinimicrobia bacterium CG08_land_8_20_14_0_20_45_22]|nr:MAG: hypothetical protein COT43_06545 [Candidatus Marinimicrobia bacterium CG08_land_8_20_14_0_20_45_22]